MSRSKNFVRSLASGYLLLGVNVLYTLASVPLALHYLSKEQFGLWALIMQFGGYIALVDFGMSGSVSRILVDYKDRRENGDYGSLLQTGALVGVAQGLLVLLIGVGLSLLAGRWMQVSAELEGDFAWLMIGQSVLLAGAFGTRIFTHILTAHQRFDVGNYAQIISFMVNFGVLWAGFATGAGVFSMLWAAAAGWLMTTLLILSGCVWLRLFPVVGQWGRPTLARFNELFRFGQDMFLFTVGSQLVNASQAILLTRWLGLETAAMWSVCTRGYTMLAQVIYRVFDYSTAGLAEMMVRGEREKLFCRFHNIVGLSASLSMVGGVIFAVCNGPFVRLWTADKFGWSPVNDWLLAVWLVLCVNIHMHTGFVGQTKLFRFLRWIYFMEGLAFVGLAAALTRWWGVTGMLAASVVCSLAFTVPYGLWRTREYFGLRWAELAAWHGGLLRLAMGLLPATALMCWLTECLSASAQLAVNGLIVGGLSGWAFLRYGLEYPLRLELQERAPVWLKSILIRVKFANGT